MTDAPAAFKGTFSDFKVIKGRKVAQVVIEVPLESADHALAALGGLPRPDAERWVAVARIIESAASEPAKPEKRRFEELPAPQQAALKCSDPAFQKFMVERFNLWDSAHKFGANEGDCATMLRNVCGVRSRAELSHDNAVWGMLLADFTRWMRSPTFA